jgi:WD40 repeat protein
MPTLRNALCLFTGLVLTAAAPVKGQRPQRQQPPARDARPAPADRYGDPLPEGALARLGTLRFRHGSAVEQAAFSPDGKQIAAAVHDGGLCVWEAATGRMLFQVGKPAYASCVAYSPDGKLLAVPGEGNAIGDTVRLIDAATGRELRLLQTTRRFGIMCLAFAPDNKTIALGSQGTVLLWNVATAQQIFQLNGHKHNVSSLAFSADGKSLASGGWDETVILWDAATGKEQARLTGLGDYVRRVAFSPGGKLLAAATWGQPLRVWDVRTRKLLHTPSGHAPAGCVAFSPDGKLLACGEDDGGITLRDPATGKAVRRWQAHAVTVTSVAFSPDGKALVSGAIWASGPRQWDVATGKELHAAGGGHHGPVTHLAFSPDGHTLLSAGSDKTLFRWDLAIGRPVHEFHWSTEGLDALTVSPDGRTLATGTFRPWGKMDRTVRLWDVDARREIRSLGPGALLGRFSWTWGFSRDGKLLAVLDKDRTPRLWDVATGKERQLPKGLGQPVYCGAFSPDGKLLATELEGNAGATIHLWDLATGREVRAWKKPERPYLLVFSPDGRVLASLPNFGGRARLWDAATGKELRSLIGSEGGFSGLTFSADGRFLTAEGAGTDGHVIVWEASTGEQVRRLKGQGGWVRSVAFAPDGRTLATGGGDSTILIWDLTGRMDHGRLGSAHLSEAALEARWNDLGGNAERAYDAGWELVAAAEQAVPFVEGHLKRAAPVSRDQVNRLIADLDSKRFATREKATRELHALGEAAEPALRQALAARPGSETRRRIEKLLAGLDWSSSPDRLRLLRVVGVLEQVGTQAARRVLARVAAATPEDRLAREAKGALERLTKRTMADR